MDDSEGSRGPLEKGKGGKERGRELRRIMSPRRHCERPLRSPRRSGGTLLLPLQKQYEPDSSKSKMLPRKPFIGSSIHH